MWWKPKPVLNFEWKKKAKLMCNFVSYPHQNKTKKQFQTPMRNTHRSWVNTSAHVIYSYSVTNNKVSSFLTATNWINLRNEKKKCSTRSSPTFGSNAFSFVIFAHLFACIQNVVCTVQRRIEIKFIHTFDCFCYQYSLWGDFSSFE